MKEFAEKVKIAMYRLDLVLLYKDKGEQGAFGMKKDKQEKKPLEKKLVNKGYARKGDRVATVKPAVPGKNGKNVLGESISVKPVFIPRLIAGNNIRVDGGLV